MVILSQNCAFFLLWPISEKVPFLQGETSEKNNENGYFTHSYLPCPDL